MLELVIMLKSRHLRFHRLVITWSYYYMSKLPLLQHEQFQCLYRPRTPLGCQSAPHIPFFLLVNPENTGYLIRKKVDGSKAKVLTFYFSSPRKEVQIGLGSRSSPLVSSCLLFNIKAVSFSVNGIQKLRISEARDFIKEWSLLLREKWQGECCRQRKVILKLK